MEGLLITIATGTGINLVVLIGAAWSLGSRFGKLEQKVTDINEKGCSLRKTGDCTNGRSN